MDPPLMNLLEKRGEIDVVVGFQFGRVLDWQHVNFEDLERERDWEIKSRIFFFSQHTPWEYSKNNFFFLPFLFKIFVIQN